MRMLVVLASTTQLSYLHFGMPSMCVHESENEKLYIISSITVSTVPYFSDLSKFILEIRMFY